MDLEREPDRSAFAEKLALLHTRGKPPTGKFGFGVPTALRKVERTVVWEERWARCFANLLKDVIRYDGEVNGMWPEYDAACNQLLEGVIPRLLGALQSDGQNIEPALIHGDLWEQNVGIDMESGETILFDPGSTYAHNEMEFGTWRCSWARYFNSPLYTRLYQQHTEPSEPVDEWDDRNRLYSLHPYLNDSAGHPGSISRQT
jgi:protein-ribulosamine 3-kinase